MFRVGLGHFEGLSTRPVVEQVVSQCKKQMKGVEAQLGIIFAGSRFNHKEMLSLFSEAFPRIQLVGCTTAGIFTSMYGFSEDSISLLVINTGGVEFRTGLGDNLRQNHRKGVQDALASVQVTPSQIPQLAFIFPNGFNAPFDPILQELTKGLGDCQIFGGIAGVQNQATQEVRQFYNKDIYTDAMPMVVFYGDILQEFTISHSWRPLGKKAEVTHSQGERVYTIDNRRAIDFYHHYLGYHEDPAWEFNLAVHPVDEEYFYVRAPNHYHKDGSISFSETIPQGAKIQLTEAIRDDMFRDTSKTLKRFSLSAKSVSPAFALAFSCSFRKNVMGTEVDREIEFLQNNLSQNLPIVGFHSFGEISPLVAGGQALVHGATLVTLVVGPGDAASVAPEKVEPQRCGEERGLNVECLQRKLEVSELQRKRLEESKEFSSRMHSRFFAEMEEARLRLEKQEKELKKSEEKFRRIVQTSAEGFVLLNDAMIIQEVNDSYLKMLGFSREEMIGHEHLDFVSPSMAQYILSNREKLMAREKRSIEGNLVAKDGREIPVLIHSNILRDDTGQPIGHMAFITNMTEQKKALSLAGEVQQSMLPQSQPDVPGIDVAGRNVSCDEVGGDYYDFFYEKDSSSGVIAVVVGDISGHGVDAALFMTSARASLRVHAAQSDSPSEIVSGLNRHLTKDVTSSNRFMTLFYLKVTLGFESLHWVRAGHEPAIYYSATHDTCEDLVGLGLALGLVEGAHYEVHKKEAPQHGDIVAIATDGMWEAINLAGEMFGRHRLQKIIENNKKRSAGEILDACFDALDTFTAGTRAEDDRTLVIMKIMKDI